MGGRPPRGVTDRAEPSGASTRLIDVDVERAVPGGVMLARHDGRVVLVSGAIPGERVRARVDRERRDVIHATTVEVLAADADRRSGGDDPACGGQVYRHIAYPRQCRLKAEVIRDALGRLGKVTTPEPLVVLPSPEPGYRLRARLHLGRALLEARGEAPARRRSLAARMPREFHHGLLGFRREGSHDVCSVVGTGQLQAATERVVEQVGRGLDRSARRLVEHVEIAENIAATERVVHYQLRAAAPRRVIERWTAETDATEVTGVTARVRHARGLRLIRGTAVVSDPLAVVGRPGVSGTVVRRAPSFFQANRYLLPTLVDTVCGRLGPGPVLDLYAGVGLFAVSAASLRGDPVTAVERDPDSLKDLGLNARSCPGSIEIVTGTVEDYLAARSSPLEGPVIVDPPRAGLSRTVVERLATLRAPRLVYVSCDVATFARDVGRLSAAGYSLRELTGLDMFPNTGHVELVGTLTRATSAAEPRSP